MEDLNRLYTALQNADKAGDTEAAKKLASYIRYVESEQQPTAPTATAAPTEPQKEAGFFSSLWESAAQTPKIATAAVRYAADQSEENRRALIEAGKSEYSGLNWDDVHNVPDFWKYIKAQAGSSLGQMVAPVLAGAGASAAAGSATAATVIGAPVSPLAAAAAGTGAFVDVAAVQYAAQEALRHAQEAEEDIKNGRTPKPLSLGKVAVASLSSAALDAFEPKVFRNIFGKLPFAKKLLGVEGKAASQQAEEQLIDAFKNNKITYAGGIAKGVGKGAAFEVPQEIAQQALERWSVGDSLTDADAFKEYKEAAIGAAILGGAAGSVDGFLDTSHKKLQAVMAMEQQEAGKTQGETETTGAPSPPAPQPDIEALSEEDIKKAEAEKAAATATEPVTEPAKTPAAEAGTVESVVAQAATQAKAQEQAAEAEKVQAQEQAAQAQAQQQAAAQPAQGGENVGTGEVGKQAEVGAGTAAGTSGVSPVLPVSQQESTEGQPTKPPQQGGLESPQPNVEAAPTGEVGGAPALKTSQDVRSLTNDDLRAKLYTGWQNLKFNLTRKGKQVEYRADELAGLLKNIDEGVLGGDKKSAKAREDIVNAISDSLGLEKVAAPKAKRGPKPKAAVAETAAPTVETKEAPVSETQRVIPSEDEIYGTTDLDKLGDLLYKATFDENDDARKDGIGEEKYAEVSKKLDKLKGDVQAGRLPKKEAFAKTLSIQDEVAKAHGYQLEQSGAAKADTATGIEDVEGAEKNAPKQTGKQLTSSKLRAYIESDPRNSDIVRIAEFLRDTADSPLYRLLASRFVQILKAMRAAGIKIGTVRYTELGAGKSGVMTWALLDNKAFTGKNIGLQIRLADNADYGTLFHELVHAVLVPLRALGRLQAFNKEYGRISSAVNLYERVSKTLIKSFKEIKDAINSADNEKINAARKKYGNDAVAYLMNDIAENDTPLIKTNAFKDPDEVFSWVLASPRAWKFAELIPFKSTGLVGRASEILAVVFRKLMGLSAKYDTALEAVLRTTADLTGSENLLVEAFGKQYKDAGQVSKVMSNTKLHMATKTTAPNKQRTPEEIIKQGVVDVNRVRNKNKPKRTMRELFSNQTYEAAVGKLVDSRRALHRLQEQMKAAAKILYTGDYNNFYDMLSIRAALTTNYLKQRLEDKYVALDRAIQDLAKTAKMDVDAVLGTVDRYMKSLHVNERRGTKFMMFSPLNDTRKNFRWTDENGKTSLVGAATLRFNIWTAVYENPNLSDATLTKFRTILNDLTKNGSPYLDINGISLAEQIRPGMQIKPGKWSIDRNNEQYNVLGGYTVQEMDDLKAAFDADPNKDKYQAIIDAARAIQDEGKALDKEANYWSKPVENISKLYGWENYVPLTGKDSSKVSENDDLLELYGSKLGSVSVFDNTIASPFSGRVSESDNVILAIQSLSARAAGRLAQLPSVQALANASKQKILGAKYVTTIKFGDRLKGIESVLTDPASGRRLQSNNIFVQYKDDGSIDIYQFHNESHREAVRRSYREDDETKAVWDALNKATSFIGRNYTRFNIDFGPKNFVRDSLTNAGVISAEKGLRKGTYYIWNIATHIATAGWGRALNVARLFEKNDFKRMATLAKTDDFYKGAYEFLTHGGDVTFLNAYLSKSQQEQILDAHLKDARGVKWAVNQSKNAIAHVFDVWGRSFELSARVAAFNMEKAELMHKGVPEKEAMFAAAAYAKELANFEKKSEFSKKAGGLYAFFRPSAISAVRNMDALRPIFVRNAESMMYDAPAVLRDVSAMDKVRADLSKRRLYAWSTVLTALGAGAAIYMILKSMAGDDDDGRNTVASDDMGQWARSIRIPTTLFGGDDPNDMIQIPFGFGLGAFSAVGAQIASAASGHQPIHDMTWNIFNITLDSFLPLPIARFDPFQGNANVSPSVAFIFWGVESAMPTPVRPWVEWLANTSGLGQSIGKRTSTSKYGDAYTASETVPEFYNDLAKGIEKATGGGIDLEPGELKFMMNAYTSAVSTLASDLYGLSLLAYGQKDFVPKEDIPAIGGFIGKRPSPDPRAFYKNVNEINNLTAEMKKLQSGIERGDESFLDRTIRFNDKNPGFELFVKEWNSGVAQLNKINEQLKAIKSSAYGEMPPNERKAQVKVYEAMRDGTMRNLNAMYAMYKGEDPDKY